MDLESLTLLVPEKQDEERSAVAAAWTARGGQVLRLGRFWDPPRIEAARVRVYGNETFCWILAEKLQLILVTPPDDLLAHAPVRLLQRGVRVAALRDVPRLQFPVFVKSVIPKQFQSAVYRDAEALESATRGLEEDTAVLVSDVVDLVAEARAFVLGGVVQTCAIYEGTGDAQDAAQFAGNVVQSLELPITCVVDVGRVRGGGWVLIEANAVWGAGLNGCAPEKAIACIAVASGPAA